MHSSTMIAKLSHACRCPYRSIGGAAKTTEGQEDRALVKVAQRKLFCPHCPPLRCPAADSHVHLTRIPMDKTPMLLTEHLELTDYHQVVKGGIIASD